jgi:hypothetical protein
LSHITFYKMKLFSNITGIESNASKRIKILNINEMQSIRGGNSDDGGIINKTK